MKKGFTLIEILLVMAIIGTLVGLLIPYLMKAKCRASEGGARSYIDNLGSALEMYKADAGIYPKSDEGFSSKILYEELSKPKSTEDASPYVDFKKENLCNDNVLCTRDKWPYFYRNNWAVNYGKSDNLVGHNSHGVDIWTADCDYIRKTKSRLGGNGCFKMGDPEEVEKMTRVKNW